MDDQFKLLHTFIPVFKLLEAKAVFLLNELHVNMETYKKILMAKEDLSYDQLYY